MIMRNRFAMILAAALLVTGGAGAVHADSQKVGQGSMSGSSSGSAAAIVAVEDCFSRYQ
jgi:hypothetical protein